MILLAAYCVCGYNAVVVYYKINNVIAVAIPGLKSPYAYWISGCSVLNNVFAATNNALWVSFYLIYNNYIPASVITFLSCRLLVALVLWFGLTTSRL